MVNCLESFKPRSFVIKPVWTQAQGNTTAAAKTGPARGPHPASSTPATNVSPFCQSSDSCASRCQYFAAIVRNLWRPKLLNKRNRIPPHPTLSPRRGRHAATHQVKVAAIHENRRRCPSPWGEGRVRGNGIDARNEPHK